MKALLYIIAIIIIIIIGCEPPQDVNRPGDKMDGYITYTDTNLITSGGYYSVSVYNADSINPFNRVPIITDSLDGFFQVDLHMVTTFSLDGIPSGRVYVAATWSRYPKILNEIPMILGTYGCDTSASCTTHKIVYYPNTQGNFRNIGSWTDTTKRLN